MNVLALGAHPDDLEYMCGGTLLKCAARGDQIFIALTTSGNTGSNVIPTKAETAAVREAEQLQAAEAYGAQVRFLRFEDEGLRDTPESRSAVLSAVRWADPELILVNPPWDQSPDHGMTGKLLTAVLPGMDGNLHNAAAFPPNEKRPSVFFFSTGAAVDFEPDIYVNIGEYIEKKVELCLMHKSQFDWIGGFMDASFEEYCRTLSRYFGIRAGCACAEGFVAHRVPGFMPNYKLLP